MHEKKKREHQIDTKPERFARLQVDGEQNLYEMLWHISQVKRELVAGHNLLENKIIEESKLLNNYGLTFDPHCECRVLPCLRLERQKEFRYL